MSGTDKQQLLSRQVISVCHPDFPTPQMVESGEAIESLPAFLKMKEIDVYYIGQNDLAESMGCKGHRKNPKVRTTVEDAIKRIADAGKVPRA